MLVILAATLIAGVVATALATSGTIYTWEKTFEVKEWKPEIKCKIEIGDHRVVGASVKVWVLLRLEDELQDHWRNEWHEECEDDREDYWEDGPHVNGTYSVNLYWWNETTEDWQHYMVLQEETNITLTFCKHIQTYMFIPEMEGEYKVVVMFAMDSETYNFTNED